MNYAGCHNLYRRLFIKLTNTSSDFIFVLLDFEIMVTITLSTAFKQTTEAVEYILMYTSKYSSTGIASNE